MNSPFGNDIFSLIYEAFRNLFPDKDCECYWNPDIEDEVEGVKSYGNTIFGDDGIVTVFVTPTLPVCDCAEVFAHELAHVAVGIDAGHGPEWEDAFDKIFQEYHRLSEQLFDVKTTISVVDGKEYRDLPEGGGEDG